MRRWPGPFLRRLRTAAVVTVCALALVACGKKAGEQAGGKSQVVAHVGNEVVTTQELENEFRWENIPVGKQNDPDSIRKVLNDLVVRKYLLQQAVDAKLDREPGVLLDMLRAREQVLANAMMSRAAAAKPPGKADVDDFIARNPLKFAGRRLLSVEQVGFPLGPNSQPIIEASRAAHSLDEVERQLTQAGIVHARQAGVLNSAELPQDVAAAVLGKSAGDLFYIRSGANGVIFQIKAEEPRPLEGEAASDLARQLLRADALKAEAGVAAMSAKLEAKFDGEYAKIMNGASASAEPGK